MVGQLELFFVTANIKIRGIAEKHSMLAIVTRDAILERQVLNIDAIEAFVAAVDCGKNISTKTCPSGSAVTIVGMRGPAFTAEGRLHNKIRTGRPLDICEPRLVAIARKDNSALCNQQQFTHKLPPMMADYTKKIDELGVDIADRFNLRSFFYKKQVGSSCENFDITFMFG